MRLNLRARALKSTYYMGKAVVGFKDLDPDLHLMLAQWIQNGAKRKLGLAPRDHLKTSVWTIADTCRRIVNNPDIRILIVNETANNARNFLSRIKAVFERNQVFQWLFPEVIPDFNEVRWTQDQIEVKRKADFPEGTVEVIGVGGASTSRHYNLIKEDDLVGKEASESPAVMLKAIDQHKLAESLLNSPADEIQTYGTRWHPQDLVEWMYKHEPVLDHLRLEIYKPDGVTPIWPKRFPPHEIENLRVKYGPQMFGLQYLNRVVGAGLTNFDLEWLREYSIGSDHNGQPVYHLHTRRGQDQDYKVALSDLEVFTIVDPCLSPESGAARSAIVTVGITPHSPYDIILLGAVAKKVAPNATIDLAVDAWKEFNPLSISIEVTAGQITFFYWIPERHPDLPIRKLKTDLSARAKERRIRALAPYFEQGRVFVHPTQTDFLEEYTHFPEWPTRDILDSLGYGPSVWSAPGGSTQQGADDDEWDHRELDSPANDGRSEVTGY